MRRSRRGGRYESFASSASSHASWRRHAASSWARIGAAIDLRRAWHRRDRASHSPRRRGQERPQRGRPVGRHLARDVRLEQAPIGPPREQLVQGLPPRAGRAIRRSPPATFSSSQPPRSAREATIAVPVAIAFVVDEQAASRRRGRRACARRRHTRAPPAPRSSARSKSIGPSLRRCVVMRSGEGRSGSYGKGSR